MNWNELENALKERAEKELEEELTSLVESILKSGNSNSSDSNSTPLIPSVPGPPDANVIYAVPGKNQYGGWPDPPLWQSFDILVLPGNRSDYTVTGVKEPAYGIINEEEVVYPKWEWVNNGTETEPNYEWQIINQEEVVYPKYGWKEVYFNEGGSMWDVSTFYVKDNSGTKEPSTLIDIDRLYFNDDLAVALDVGPGGVAGEVYRIYKAAFNRIPDSFGMGYWIDQRDDGMEMWEMAARFIDSEEFRTLYGENPTDTEFLDMLYRNVLGREPEEQGYSWWLYQLANNASKTREKVLTDFSEGWENMNNVAALIADGIPYTIWS